MQEGGREREKMLETEMMSQVALYLEGLEVRHHRLTFSKHQQLLLSLMRPSFTHSQTCDYMILFGLHLFNEKYIKHAIQFMHKC